MEQKTEMVLEKINGIEKKDGTPIYHILGCNYDQSISKGRTKKNIKKLYGEKYKLRFID